MTSEVLFITDTCILIKMCSSLFVEKYKIIVKELHCSIREVRHQKFICWIHKKATSSSILNTT